MIGWQQDVVPPPTNEAPKTEAQQALLVLIDELLIRVDAELDRLRAQNAASPWLSTPPPRR